ncbi:hypothetical protein CHARACLAT_001164 [Characodon lateralis]|uniref:Interleukin-6 n=1 Tax=Characodon lateralis TaxID=208331 RepID=A0ABU7EFF4_9TELE|nr:hypothetical protein [Characodon lateralis]
MFSKFNLRLLAAVMLAAALPLCVPGAPLKDPSTDPTPAESSGEEDEEEGIVKTWRTVISFAERHKKEFEDEFQGNAEFHSLVNNSFPVFPKTFLSKEACFQRLVQGLLKYTVLLKHVDREYHNSSIVTGVNEAIPRLIKQIIANIGNGGRVVALTSSQEQQLLKELDSPDDYERKMTAHRILYSMRNFIIDSRRGEA